MAQGSTRGGWDRAGEWVPVPFIDGEAAALVFRRKVFSFLRAEGLLSEERRRLLLSWWHSGFSVHNTETVPPDDGGGQTASAALRSSLSDALHLRGKTSSTQSPGARYWPRHPSATLRPP